MSFRAYVTDCLRVLSMGKQYSGEIDRWADIISPPKRAQANLTGAEAIERIRRKLRG